MAILFKQIFCGLGNDGNSKASKQCKEMKCEKEEEGVINGKKQQQLTESFYKKLSLNFLKRIFYWEKIYPHCETEESKPFLLYFQ